VNTFIAFACFMRSGCSNVPRHVIHNYNATCLKRFLACAAPSPLDISMDSSKLQKELSFPLQKFAAALKDVFPRE
jgi:hypothetical protein